MFDINSLPSRHRVLGTGVIEGRAFDASLEIVLAACEYFDATLKTGETWVAEIAATLSQSWKEVFREQGALSGQIRSYAESFEHEEAERAKGFGGEQ